ncbi:MAG: alpha/beta fold hydrolase [Pseudomonadota bacterium]
MACFVRPSGDIHYQLDGQGPTITFVHGVGSYLESWDGVIKALGLGFCTLQYDLRGHGQSAKVPGPYALADFVDDLTDLLDHLGINKTTLVGFSLGGLIAQAFALAHPDKLEKMVLVSTIAGRTDEERRRVQKRAQTLAQEGALSHLAEAVDRWFTADFIIAHPEVLEERRRRSLNNDPGCYAAAYRVLAEADLADELHRIAVPTLAMTGERDVGSTPHMTKLIAEKVQWGHYHILPRLKHSVLLEAPNQVGEQILGFLDNCCHMP